MFLYFSINIITEAIQKLVPSMEYLVIDWCLN